jgi:hypothetical protein
MDTLIPVLLGLLVLGVGLLIYLYLFQKNPGGDLANQNLLIADLKSQIKNLQNSLQAEQDLKSQVFRGLPLLRPLRSA